METVYANGMERTKVTPDFALHRKLTDSKTNANHRHVGMMSHIDNTRRTPLLDIWDRYLTLQSAILGPHETLVMRQWGFGSTNRGILDVGCGNGVHGVQLANQFPHVSFYGIDVSTSLLAQASELMRGKGIHNYEVFRCDIGHDTLPPALQGTFDQCLLRFVLQHSDDPLAMLTFLKAHLPIGGQVFVIEEDEGFYQIYPECPAYRRIAEYFQRVGDALGSTRCLGRRTPELMQQAGFRVRQVQVLMHNNLAVGELFMDYLKLTAYMLHLSAPQLVTEAEARGIEEELDDYLRQHRDHWFGVYPQVLVMGEKVG